MSLYYILYVLSIVNEVKDPETGEEYQRIVPGTSQDPPPGKVRDTLLLR